MLKKAVSFVLGSEQSRPPHHLGGADKHGATYSSHRAPSTYRHGKERVLARLGWAGVIGYASGCFSAAALLNGLFEHPAKLR
jgi:hypothetical protein